MPVDAPPRTLAAVAGGARRCRQPVQPVGPALALAAAACLWLAAGTADAGKIAFSFANRMPATVTSIRLAPTGSTFWTANLIESHPLADQAEAALGLETIGTGCRFDIVVTFQDIEEIFFDGDLDLCRTPVYALTPELFGGNNPGVGAEESGRRSSP